MDRKSIILKYVKKDGKGIEIAPAHSPILPKSQGYDVKVIDVCDRQQLVEKFKSFPVDINRIEEVDYIWSGQSYADLVGQTQCFDFIVASHVIEHTTDIITFLNDCDSLLKDDGVLSLAIPDKRTCFDYFRSLSGIDKVIDAHLSKNTLHTVGTRVDFELNFCRKSSGLESWPVGENDDLILASTTENARYHLNNLSAEYIDVHNWVFVPHSFRLLVHDLYELGLIKLRELFFHNTMENEFYVTLSRQGNGSGLSRLDILKIIQSEQSHELAQTRSQLQSTQQELAQIKGSKFWKLRNLWFKVKRKLKL